MRLSPDEAPVLEIQTADLAELDNTLRSMRAQGVWSALKGAAREFADAPLAGVEATVLELIPGSQVIVEEAPDGTSTSTPEPQVDLAAEAAEINRHNAVVVERARERGEVENPSLPPWDVKPPKQTLRCRTCGAPATHSGQQTGKNGTWSADFCSTGNRDHTHYYK